MLIYMVAYNWPYYLSCLLKIVSWLVKMAGVCSLDFLFSSFLQLFAKHYWFIYLAIWYNARLFLHDDSYQCDFVLVLHWVLYNESDSCGHLAKFSHKRKNLVCSFFILNCVLQASWPGSWKFWISFCWELHLATHFTSTIGNGTIYPRLGCCSC